MKYTREGYEALKADWDEEISKAYDSGDEFEQTRATILSNKEIHEYWCKLRTVENGLTPEQIREQYLGKRITISNGSKHFIRTLREDDKGFFAQVAGEKARLYFDPVFTNFKVKHFEPRK